MQEREILDLFKKCDAYKQGHFKLSSGLHSGAYLQCALVLQDPIVSEKLCKSLSRKVIQDEPDVIIGPAMGGIVLAYELARQLKARAVFSERDNEGKMQLRRGFAITAQNRVVIAEDVLTTGKSVKEVIEMLKMDGITPVGIVSLVDRSGGKLDFGGIKYESLLKLDVPTFHPEACPLCEEGYSIEKPGSRKEI